MYFRFCGMFAVIGYIARGSEAYIQSDSPEGATGGKVAVYDCLVGHVSVRSKGPIMERYGD